MIRRVFSTCFSHSAVSRQRRIALVLLFALMSVSYGPLTTAQTGDGVLDSTFGSGGIVKTDFSGNFDGISAIAVQPDGKIVAAGATSNIPLSSLFAVARYNGDGSLDQSFGSGGRVIINTGGLENALSLALLPDGKILAGAAGYDRGSQFAMARLNNDGGLDASFGSNGVVLTDVGTADISWCMAVQPDGKILLGGHQGRIEQASSFAVVRYKKNGRIDASFGNEGKAVVEFSSGFDFAYAMALQPDGKIVLAGRAAFNSSNSPIAIARFNGDGRLDSDFGSGGKVTTNFFGRRNEANCIAVQADGKLVVAGWAARNPDGHEVLAIARYNSNGSLDPTFGTGGMLTNEFSGRGGEARAIELQRDGKIVVTGVAGFLRAARPQADFATVRYNGDGTVDGSFSNGGAAITDFGDVIEGANAIAFQQDGKIVVAGSSGDETRHSDFAIARYNNSVPAQSVFWLAFDSPTVTAQAGTKAGVTVNLNRSTGFTGNVTVSPPDSAMGIVPKPPDPITTTDATVSFKLKIKGGTPLGPHLLTFTGRDDAGHTSTATLTVIVQ